MKVISGEFNGLRADVERKTPLEAFYAATNPFGFRDKVQRKDNRRDVVTPARDEAHATTGKDEAEVVEMGSPSNRSGEGQE